MTDQADIDVQEREIRRRWHEAHIKRFDADANDAPWRDRNTTPHADEARPFLAALHNSFESHTRAARPAPSSPASPRPAAATLTDGFGAAVARALCSEVTDDRIAPLLQGVAEAGDLGGWPGRQAGRDSIGEAAAGHVAIL